MIAFFQAIIDSIIAAANFVVAFINSIYLLILQSLFGAFSDFVCFLLNYVTGLIEQTEYDFTAFESVLQISDEVLYVSSIFIDYTFLFSVVSIYGGLALGTYLLRLIIKLIPTIG